MVKDMHLKDVLQSIDVLKSSLNAVWLEDELRKISARVAPKNPSKLTYIGYEATFHPLAFLIYQADQQLKQNAAQGKFEATEQIYRLAQIGNCIKTLREKDIPGIDERINDLMSRDYAKFEKTVFELQVCAPYANRGPVRFLPTRSKESLRTADIKIEGAVIAEIECKKKDSQTPRDLRNNELWKLMARKLSALMDKSGMNYVVYVKTEQDPSEVTVNLVMREAEKVMQQKTPVIITTSSPIIRLEIIPTLLKDQEVLGTEFGFSSKEDVDFLIQSADMVPDGAILHIKNPRVLAFKSAVLPDRLMSVINSLNAAKGQLSGDVPGIIYVGLAGSQTQQIDTDFRRLDVLIAGVLRNNASISAVVITAEFFENHQDCIHYVHRSRVVRNLSARHPLPLDYRLVGESD